MYTLIDTPGFDDSSMDDMDILKIITSYCCQHSTQPIDGILYLHRITDLKFSGRDMLKLRLLQALCGNEFYPHLTIVSTMWNRIPNEEVRSQCKKRLTELMTSPRHWGGMIGSTNSEGANHFPFLGDQESGLAIMRHVNMVGHPKYPPRFLQELLSGRLFDETEAASIVLMERRKREEKMRQEIEEERLELETEMREVQAERLKQMKKQPQTPTDQFPRPHRSDTFPHREYEQRSPDSGRHGEVFREEQASSGRSRRDRHLNDRRGNHEGGIKLSVPGLNIHISRKR